MPEAGTPEAGETGLRREVEQEAREVLPAPAGHPRFGLFDSVRAMAAIAVLVVHVGIYSGGFGPWYKQFFAHLDIGVPAFFLLSGFLLYRPMLASRVLGLRRQRLVDYARNRFIRIFPAFWLALTVSALLPMFHGAFSSDWWAHYGLLQSWPVYTPDGLCGMSPAERGFDQFCGLPPVWSLSIEMLFYIALPFYAMAMTAVNRLLRIGRWWLVPEIVALLALSVVSFLIQEQRPVTDLQIWLFYSPLGRWYWFALGMGLAVASVWVQRKGYVPRVIGWISSVPSLWWIIAVAIYVGMTVFVLPQTPVLAAQVTDSTTYLWTYFLFGLVPMLILLPAVFGQEGGGLPRRILRHPVLAWLGLVSYGIFLWHYPVMAVLLELGATTWIPSAQFPVLVTLTFAGTVAVAALSFYLVERPLLRWSRGRSR